jgi:hypothetical protein
MSESKHSEPIQVVTAVAESVEDTGLGDEAFLKKLLEEFHTKNLWRRLESLAEVLKVDVQHLRQWLDAAPGVLRKRGKEDGVFFYCWEQRAAAVQPEEKKEKKLNKRPAVREEDRYALAMLHMTYWTLYKTMKTYGLEISQVDNDAFQNFALALDKLESGLVLFSNKTGAAVEKLPKMS